MERIAEDTAAATDLAPAERAIATLVKKSVVAPARLGPRDLAPVVDAYGVEGALEITAVLASFHFINRVADLVGIESDLPLIQPRWRTLRRLGVRLQAWGMRRAMDLSNRDAGVDPQAALAEAEAVLGPFPDGYRAVPRAPNVAAFLTTVARVARELDPSMLARVTRAVATALPSQEEEVRGFHPRPAEPLDALAFVATRYAARTTDRLVDAVREKYGYGDPELTDLFYAISMRNAFERLDRLLEHPPAGTGS